MSCGPFGPHKEAVVEAGPGPGHRFRQVEAAQVDGLSWVIVDLSQIYWDEVASEAIAIVMMAKP